MKTNGRGINRGREKKKQGNKSGRDRKNQNLAIKLRDCAKTLRCFSMHVTFSSTADRQCDPMLLLVPT